MNGRSECDETEARLPLHLAAEADQTLRIQGKLTSRRRFRVWGQSLPWLHRVCWRRRAESAGRRVPYLEVANCNLKMVNSLGMS